mmetsp:Transcript_32163/g.57593  ORF Transcript_32163/g.57593 Transcript_32163/m.57593 type:complete len:229 (+) Transcript_32163:561-1247(+)
MSLLDAFAMGTISLNVLGYPSCLQAINMQDACTAPAGRDRMVLSTSMISLYTSQARCLMLSFNPSRSHKLPIAAKEDSSALSELLLRACNLSRLENPPLVPRSIRVVAADPLSSSTLTAAPTRLGSPVSLSLSANVRHSDPSSIMWDSATSPQPVQMTSPEARASTKSMLPQSLHSRSLRLNISAREVKNGSRVYFILALTCLLARYDCAPAPRTDSGVSSEEGQATT